MQANQPYYPTTGEIARLGFIEHADEHGEAIVYQEKGHGRCLELIKDKGYAVAFEWLDGDIHAWTTCESYEALEAACVAAFDTIAQGR